MSPYREPQHADAPDPSANRLLWEGPLYPDPNIGSDKQRIRVVFVVEQKGDALVRSNKVEVLLNFGNLGEPCWIDVPDNYRFHAIMALAAAFR